MRGFNNLPPEVKVIIFGILAANGELSTRRVCKEWKDLTDLGIQYLWDDQLKLHEGTSFTALMDLARRRTEGQSYLLSFRYIHTYFFQHLLVKCPPSKDGVIPLTFSREAVEQMVEEGNKNHDENVEKAWPEISNEAVRAFRCLTPQEQDALQEKLSADLSPS